MKKEKKLKKESFMSGVLVLMLSHILIKVLGLIYKVYLTNKEGFGDKGNAIYSSGFQIYALLLTVSSVGIPNAVAKLVSERLAVGDSKGAHRVFKIAFVTFALIGFACSLILFLIFSSIGIGIWNLLLMLSGYLTINLINRWENIHWFVKKNLLYNRKSDDM